MESSSEDYATATSCCQVQDRRFPVFLLDMIIRRLFQSPERFLSKHVGPGIAAADLGCGPGFFTLPMAKIVGENGLVHAVDFDPKAIARVEKKAARRPYGRRVVPQAASAADIDFIESGSIDFVLAEGLLCCMKDHDGAVRQIRRILKPDGRAFLSVMKFSREGDPRSISKDEWASILGEFRVLDRGERTMTRWALVTQDNDTANVP